MGAFLQAQGLSSNKSALMLMPGEFRVFFALVSACRKFHAHIKMYLTCIYDMK